MEEEKLFWHSRLSANWISRVEMFSFEHAIKIPHLKLKVATILKKEIPVPYPIICNPGRA